VVLKDNNKALPVIGIVGGRGLLPAEIAKLYIERGGECYVAAILNNLDCDLPTFVPNKFFKIGEVGGVVEYFKQHNVAQVIFVGGINRPNLSSVQADLLGVMLLAKIAMKKFLGDDEVLRIIANFFEDRGFEVISAQDIILPSSDIHLTIKPPSKQDQVDIELGIKVAKSLGMLDIGQSVIVADGYVLGVEAAEGTDNLIKRCALLRKRTSGGVLIKVMKSKQDIRMDIPTIGLHTIQNLIDYSYNGVAIENGKVIISNLENTVKLANQHRIFIMQI
jgi:UDP-2,3-diacylglucosamine hydrolase